MTATQRSVLRDRELVGLLADEPELLAITDAYATTQRRYWLPTRRRSRFVRIAVLAAVVAAIVPAVVFADRLGPILGLSNSGRSVPTEVFPPYQVSALKEIGLRAGEVRLLAQRSGIGFYAAKNTAGNYCFAIGFGSAATPRLDALACQGGTIGSFPSASDPVADFSGVGATADGSTSVVTLAGFATDDVARVALLGRDGNTIASTKVENNVYAADDLPQFEAAAIVAYDQAKNVVYRRQLGPPPMPRPATP